VAALAPVVASGLAFVAPASATPTGSPTATIPVGSNPTAVAVNPTTQMVYVVNNSSNSVSVIDEATNQVTATIDLTAAAGSFPGPGHDSIAVNPATNTIYAAYETTVSLTIGGSTLSVFQGQVAVIDGATNQIATTITLPLDPAGARMLPQAMAVNPVTNTIYVASYPTADADDAVAVINGSTNQVATSIDLPDLEIPTGVAVNSLTDRVYVTTQDNLWIIDGSTNTPSPSTGMAGDLLMGVAVDESTDMVYATAGLSALVPLNGANNVTGYIPANLAGAEGVTVDADTSYAYVTSDNNTVTVVNLATSQITASFAVGSGPTGVAVDPGTDRVYVANSGSNTVSAIAIAPPTVSAGGGYSGQGGSPIAVSGTASDNYQSAPATAWSATANSGAYGTCSFADAAALTTTVTCNGPGTYTLTLTADDGLTVPATSTAQLTVTPAPITVFDTAVVDQYTLTTASPVTVDANWSDPDTADVESATVDWGDGTISTPLPGVVTPGFGFVSATHTYAKAGTFTATVTVRNGLNPPVTASQSIQITVVANTPPTVSAGGPLYRGTEGSPVTLDGSAVDPDGDTLTSQWSIPLGAESGNGTCTFANPAALDTTVTCTDEGHYELSLTVSDGVNNWTTYFSTAGLTLANAPITVGAITGLPALGASVNTPVTANATFSDPGTVGAHTATIDWGDGTTTTGTVTETVGSGAGSVSGSHSYATPGTYAVSVSVSDQAECVPDGFYGGMCLPGNTLLAAVTGTNSAQVVVNAPITASADGPYNGAEGSAINVSGTATDNVGATVTTAWSAAPSSGTDGTCTFANPAALATTVTCTGDGTYTLTLAANDGINPTVTSTTQLTVGNAPIAVGTVTASPSAAVPINSPVTVSANFTDPGTADAHTATINWGDGTTTTGTVTETVGSGTGSVSGNHAYAAGGSYSVTVTVSDGDVQPGTGSGSTQVIVNAPPTVDVGGPYNGAEGSAINLSGTATDSDGDTVTTAWTATANSGTDGTCTFANPAALDTTVTCTDQGSYTLTLTGSDGVNPTVTSTAQLTVSNAPITVSAPAGQPKSTSLVVSTNFTDPGTTDAHTATINWGDGTTTPGTVTETVGSGTGSVSGSHIYAQPSTYTVTVTVSDGDSPAGTGTNSAPFTLNTPPVVSAGGGTGGYSGAEGSAINLSGTATDSDGDTVTTAWTATANSGTDGTCTFANPAALDTTVTCTDQGSYTLTLTGSDGVNPTVTSTAQLTASNAPITVGTVTGPSAPVAINTSVAVSASFTDPGSADGHTATIDWGDGTTSAATVSETAGTGTGTASGSHTYTAAGVYTVTVTVSDGNSPAATGSSTYQYAVVYDPEAGFVTGGGTINSPAGAFPADPTLTGPAHFGFVSKYQVGSNTPVGQTEFQFYAGDVNFHSSNYDSGSLVISGPLARYTGTGTIKGSTDSYTFLVEAYDCDVTGSCATSPDGFRIQITDTTTHTLIYDNVAGGSGALSQANTEPIASGDIVIHKSS
jgi:YVTN family beta-propeller protein